MDTKIGRPFRFNAGEANIICSVRNDEVTGAVVYSFRWQGHRNDFVEIKRSEYTRIRYLLPWTTKIIKEDILRDTYRIIRTDNIVGTIDFIMGGIIYRIKTITNLLYSNLLLTDHIWGFAECRPGYKPSYKDLIVYKKGKRLWTSLFQRNN